MTTSGCSLAQQTPPTGETIVFEASRLFRENENSHMLFEFSILVL